MKRGLKFLTTLLIFTIFISSAYADVGPKPSVNIEIKGLEEGKTYYVTLLSKDESTGPYRLGKELSDELCRPGYEKFTGLKDKDGYYFISYLEKLKGPGTFSWSYYPPYDFKIAIYNVENNSVLISDPMSRYAFNSNYKMDYSDLGVKDDAYYFGSELNISKAPNVSRELSSFVLRVILTILIEYVVALIIFRPTKAQTKLIIETNIFTQIILNLAISLLLYFYGFMFYFLTLIPLEIFVFAVEAVIYKKKINIDLPVGKKPAPAILYSLIANIASAAIGYVLVRNFVFFDKIL